MKTLLLVFFVCSATITVVLSSDTPRLEIQPNQPEITRDIGSSLALTCKPDVPDAELITQLEWRDPKNRKIDTSRADSSMYIQKLGNEPGAVLVFTKLTRNLAGDYTCQAMYANTQPMVAKIKVSTFVDVTWKDAPENQYPIVGEDYKVRCEAEGNPAPIITWYRNGAEITGDNHYIVSNNALIIKGVREEDDGVFLCKAIVLSTGTIKTRTIKVEVQIPPTVEKMTELNVIEGERAEIQCKAHGKPPPTYTWIKENTRENLATTDRFDVNKNTGMLIINRVEYNDNSQYTCVAENNANQANQSVKINVLIKPNIYELLNVTAEIKKDTKLICKATGRPAPEVLFRKFSNQDYFQIGRSADNKVILENKKDNAKGETFGILTVQNLNRSDDGLYECIAENSVGTAYKNGHITVEFPPSFDLIKNYPPTWTWDLRPANLTCIAESIPNATIRWKMGNYELANNSVFEIHGNGPISSLIVKPRGEKNFFTTYECLASNRLGENRHLMELREAHVPGGILQARAESITATTIKFNIVGPQNLHGLPLRSFIVQYMREGEISWEHRARNHTWSADAPYILENLVPQGTYIFRFAAINDVGKGNWGGDQQHTMPRRSVPAEPKILSYDKDNNSVLEDQVTNSPYANHYELRWNVPNDNGDPIVSYIIRYCVTRKINGEWRDFENECSGEIKQPFQHTTYELTQLTPGTIYKIELRAENAIGQSSPAQIKVKTALGKDPMVQQHEPAQITSALIIGIVVAVIFIILIFVDLTCFCVNRAGILAMICDRACTKSGDDEDPKLSRDEKEPLKSDDLIGDKRNLSVEFDGNKVYTKPVEIGRHSAV